MRKFDSVYISLLKTNIILSDQNEERDRQITELKTLGLLNDLEYAKSYIKEKTYGTKPISKRFIETFLLKKGVGRGTIEEAFTEVLFNNDSEKEAAQRLLDKKIKALHNLPSKEIKQRVTRYLLGKGFPSEIVFPFDGFELPVDHGGSGVEMGVAVALLEAMAKISKEKIVIIIDEPELHLHPKLQGKLFDHLKEVSSEIQIISSTHSPFLFKNVYDNKDIKLQVCTKNATDISIKDARASGFGLLKWSPSWGEICYFAYELPTTEFHDDLYSSIEDKLKTTPSQKVSQDDTENWFVSKGQTKEIKWPDSIRGPQEETLMTYVRNRIHHPDNTARPMYSPEQLKDSIERMLALVKI